MTAKVTFAFTRENDELTTKFKFDEDLETILEKFEQFLVHMGFELEGQRLSLQPFVRSNKKYTTSEDGIIKFPGSSESPDLDSDE